METSGIISVNGNVDVKGNVDLVGGGMVVSGEIYVQGGGKITGTSSNSADCPGLRFGSITFESGAQINTEDVTVCDYDGNTTSNTLPDSRPYDCTCFAFLPVKLISFKATHESLTNHVLLAWETAWETQNSHFEVERSVDGKNFEAIGRVAGAGTVETSSKYTFRDMSPNRINYYRLKQIDLDGSLDYSKIVALTTENTGFEVSVDPFSNTIQIEKKIGNQTKVFVYNEVGKIIATQDLQINESNYYSISIPETPQYQLYIVAIHTNEGVEVKKVLYK